MDQKIEPGKLYLIPTGIADNPPERFLPEENRAIIRSLSVFIVEEVKTAIRFLKHSAGIGKPEEMTFLLYNEHTVKENPMSFLECTLNGRDTGLLSEAGLPCIADPGWEIVSVAHQLGVRVVPLSGPSSLMMALMASGFNGQNFAFEGYLPIAKHDRIRKIKELERRAFTHGQTQLFIETPYRNNTLFEILLQVCRPDTRLCVAMGIMTGNEFIRTDTIYEWKKMPVRLDKIPAVFLVGR